jgi:hypothetical protein
VYIHVRYSSPHPHRWLCWLTYHHFRPALTSSSLGLLTIAYNFLASRSFTWGTAAISGTVTSATSTLLYGILLLWAHRRIVKLKEQAASRANLWSEQSYYTNFVANMYPSASRSPSAHPPDLPLSEDDRINQQMALLLMKNDPGPSPSDAPSATFRIDLPEDREMGERIANSRELVGTPPLQALQQQQQQQQYYLHQQQQQQTSLNHPRADRDSLGETHAWSQWQDRGRPTNRPSSIGSRSDHSRGLSREERRREIELGLRV